MFTTVVLSFHRWIKPEQPESICSEGKPAKNAFSNTAHSQLTILASLRFTLLYFRPMADTRVCRS